MPSYDLKCQCGHEFNLMASMSDRENKRISCPVCGSNALDPVFKSLGIISSRRSPERPSCPNAHVCGGGCAH
ncbi:MAG: regulatory protein FmdB family [Paenibacillaceae bacterium]|jgi:putative FmdB family regulatory protein|nr:regulatory protein FmdB family [Paenibacillaceae bacterium]